MWPGGSWPAITPTARPWTSASVSSGERSESCEIDRDTIFVFTADHGDMLHSKGEVRKHVKSVDQHTCEYKRKYQHGDKTGKTHHLSSCQD